MKFFDFIIIVILFLLLGLGIYVLWYNLPSQTSEFEDFEFEHHENVSSQGIQFYPNMRYRDKEISYSIADSCDLSKRREVERAFSYLSQKTILKFSELERGEIRVLCSNISPKPEEEGHFVAGEGGPSEVINTSVYSVILSGKVSLYRDISKNRCARPNVAIHEILHALGFDHNANKESIMYPVTECEQTLDQYIVDAINKLYSSDSLPDLVVEKVKATKNGQYLNFEAVVGNFGFKDSVNSSLVIYADGEKVKEFILEEIEIGTRKKLNVENVRIPRSATSLKFEVVTREEELDKKNNDAEIKLGD